MFEKKINNLIPHYTDQVDKNVEFSWKLLKKNSRRQKCLSYLCKKKSFSFK